MKFFRKSLIMFLPLHSFVVDFSNKHYESNEAISYPKVKNILFNKCLKFESENIIFDFMLDIIVKKLKLGERVILFDAKEILFFEKRKELLEKVSSLTKNIFYIVPDDFRDKNIILGDDTAQVVKNSKLLGFIEKFDYENLIEVLQNNKKITIVGDVHGQYESLLNVIDWAKKMNSFLIFLGDIIDYGPKSLECLEIIYDLIIRNKCILILGNHERKLFRWLEKNKNQKSKLFLSESNKQTINKINYLSKNEKSIWVNKFKTVVQLSRTHLIFDNLIATHAAYKEEMNNFKRENFLPKNLENFALLGKNFIENEELRVDKSWLNEIRENVLVFVGHENSKKIKPPFVSKNNSKIYFMDTGSGKGGNLSSVDLIFNKNKKTWEILNFNFW